MNISTEIIIVILLVIFFIIIAKIFENIKWKGKIIKVPKVISIIVTGFIIGLIIRAINPDFMFDIVPYFSMISIAILFVAFGAMTDFASLKKIGLSAILLGSVPYILEITATTTTLTLLTQLEWFEAGIVSVVIFICAPGVTASRLLENIKMSYEQKAKLNETISLAGAVENIISLVAMIGFLSIYLIGYNDAGTALATLDAKAIAISIFGILPAILIIGAIIGIVLGFLTIYIIKPLSNILVKPQKMATELLNDDQKEEVEKINKRALFKNNLLTTVILFAIMAAIYLALQLTLGLGFIILEAALVLGVMLSLFGSKSIDSRTTQFAIAKNSNVYYSAVGCMIVWGFSGILIDPTYIFSSGWSSLGNGNIANILWIFIVILVSFVARSLGIILVMSFNPKYTTKQKIYTILPFYTKGTGGLNNGVTILLVLGITSSTGALQYDHAIYMRQMSLSFGTLMVFITIPIGVLLMGWLRDRLIFIWENKTEGEYSSQLKKAIKSSNISKEESKELIDLNRDFWKKYYSKFNLFSKANKTLNKNNNNLEREINYLTEKKEKLILNQEIKKNKFQMNYKSLEQRIELTKKKTDKEKLITKQKELQANFEDSNQQFNKIKSELENTIKNKQNEIIKIDIESSKNEDAIAYQQALEIFNQAKINLNKKVKKVLNQQELLI